MSKFSEYLKLLIDSSDESISSIARSIGAERTSIHKAIKGERILPSKAAHALAIHLKLSLEESQEFFRLYDMQLQGEALWYNRTSVCEMLNQLAAIQFHPDLPIQQMDGISQNFNPSFEYKLVEGEYSVQTMIYSLLSWEIQQKPDAHLRMFLPFGIDFASIFLKLWYSGAHFTTDHLFCFPSNTDGDCSKSIRILKQVIPICLTAKDYYHPYYFYEKPEALSANPLSHYIITPHYLILLARDSSMALIHSSDRIIGYYTNHFSGLMDYCEPFVSFTSSLPDVLKLSTDMLDRDGALYVMPQPCFGLYTTPKMIAKYFKSQDFSEEIYEDIISHFSIVQGSKNFTSIFSEKGLRTFIDEGKILEYPDDYVLPLDTEDRLTFIKQLRDDIASEKMNGRIARPSALNIPDYLTVYIDTSGNVWFDTTRCFIHDAFYCNIHITEKSICRALQDFSKSIVGSQMLYSKNETVNILNEAIGELEKM